MNLIYSIHCVRCFAHNVLFRFYNNPVDSVLFFPLHSEQTKAWEGELVFANYLQYTMQSFGLYLINNNGNPLQYSCPENPVYRGAWWTVVHGVAQSRIQLKRLSMHALKKEMATHSSILAWGIPGTEEPGGLPSMGSHRVRHDWRDLAAAAASTINSVCVCVCVCSVAELCLFSDPWTVASQAPLSMGFSRQEYWIGLPFLTPGDLPNSGIEHASLASPALAGVFFTTSALMNLKRFILPVYR